MRVHNELYEWLNELAKKNGDSLVQTSKQVAQEHKEIKFFLEEQKLKKKKLIFSEFKL